MEKDEMPDINRTLLEMDDSEIAEEEGSDETLNEDSHDDVEDEDRFFFDDHPTMQ